jgi:anthranilate synthase/aminodeoxychorismate synthase-like glutamine amidotransferase
LILLIDNYDSFTYNLLQAFGALDRALDIRVRRNDEITCEDIEREPPAHIVISPGPCTPREAGQSVEIVRRFSGRVPILGVCLGHQCIAYAAGGAVIRAARLLHGKTSMVRHDDRGVFRGLSNPFQATRYHSLIVEEQTLPAEFEVSARVDDRPEEIMGIRHRRHAVEGVQFHPESFLTPEGGKLLANFLAIR